MIRAEKLPLKLRGLLRKKSTKIAVVSRIMKRIGMSKRLRDQQGLSLLELLIFITVLSLIFLGTAYATTRSMQQTQFNKHKLLATRYAEEIEEWMRGKKEEDWADFYNNKAASGDGNTYCFDDEVYDEDNNISWPGVSECGSSYNLDDLYQREAVLIHGAGSQVQVYIEVTWQDGPNIYSVPIQTVFSRWE